LENWTLGLSLIALTITMHAGAIALAALKMQRIRGCLEHRELRLAGTFVVLVGLIGTLGLLLVILHGLEAAAWAVAYRWLGALDTAHNAILYSLDAISTRGSSHVLLGTPWQIMGALEAVDGMLLFGISTAFIFAVMQNFWPILVDSRPHHPMRDDAPPLGTAGQRRGRPAALDSVRLEGQLPIAE
jgi:hypothetical protein